MYVDKFIYFGVRKKRKILHIKAYPSYLRLSLRTRACAILAVQRHPPTEK